MQRVFEIVVQFCDEGGKRYSFTFGDTNGANCNIDAEIHALGFFN